MTNRGAFIHHSAFVVSDLARTREFYVDVLGFEEIHRPMDFVFHGAYFRLGEAEIHVVQEGTPHQLRDNSELVGRGAAHRARAPRRDHGGRLAPAAGRPAGPRR